MRGPVVFRVCEWLSSEDYSRLREFSDYLGRRGGCSVFAFKYTALRSRSLRSYVELLERLGAEIVEGRDVLEELLREQETVYLEADREGFLLRSRVFLAPLLSEARVRGLVYYSRRRQAFVVKPYALVEVVESLRAQGLEVVDNTCLLGCEGRRLGVEFRGSLRSYQEEAVNAWLGNKRRGLVALPTGAGKTVVAIYAMSLVDLPTLIIVYTREQMLEWREKLLKFTNLSVGDVGLFYGEEKRTAKVTIATYQSAYRNMDLLYDRFSLLVVDEAHHLPAEKFRLIAERSLAPYRLGLSATPYREDGRHEELFALLGGIVYEKSVEELESMGYIAPYTIIPRLVSLAPDELRKYRELRRAYQVLARGRRVEELVKAAASGDESARKALQLLSETRKLLAHSRAKLEEAKSIVESELGRGSKVIVFTQYVSQAEQLGKLLGAPVLTGKTDTRRRRLILELFKKGRYRVLVLTTVGDEGLDIPDADVGVILSGTSSKRQFIQRLGRLLRPASGKTARLYYIAVKGSQEEATMKKLLSAL